MSGKEFFSHSGINLLLLKQPWHVSSRTSSRRRKFVKLSDNKILVKLDTKFQRLISYKLASLGILTPRMSRRLGCFFFAEILNTVSSTDRTSLNILSRSGITIYSARTVTAPPSTRRTITIEFVGRSLSLVDSSIFFDARRFRSWNVFAYHRALKAFGSKMSRIYSFNFTIQCKHRGNKGQYLHLLR